jgi:SAM-dependent methyltransferase
MGAGYAVPYLDPYLESAERIFSVMPAHFGVHAWTPRQKNLACIAAEAELPVETESVDRVLVCHGLEYSDYTEPCLQEYWRVLKSTGRILIVVPNRLGFWSRAEWSPFGHGTPFSLSQLTQTLRDNLFVIERVERALYLPALRSSMLLRSFMPLERYGRYMFGGMPGVLMVEASKQLYSGLLAHNTAKARIGGRKILVPSTAARS